MKDEGWTRDEPDSPCKKICIIHPESGLCLGCFRTAAEIRRWAKFPEEKRHELLAELPAREKGIRKRRGGRRRNSRSRRK
ncbi:MAG: DUF1289 domain-containing protein [Albidovulum sp.]|nr:DUF1289 domain-containing protein [Albidovulum sp.]